LIVGRFERAFMRAGRRWSLQEDTMQEQFASAAQEAGAKTKAEADAVRGEARRTAEDVRDQFAQAAESAKEQFGEAAQSVKEKARAMADDQKAAGAERVSGLARAIDHAADELQDDLPQAAGFVRQAASKVEEVSTMIRERSVEDLVQEANGFARANTVAFFGMSLVAGFALARFLKSDASSHSRPSAGAHWSPEQPHPTSQRAGAAPDRFAPAPSTQF
jgi:hypothetical protein